MTDIEMTRLCAEAMGYVHAANINDPDSYPIVQFISPTTGWRHETPHFLFINGPSERPYPKYDPLDDDAQAMALVKRFSIQVHHHGFGSAHASLVTVKGRWLLDDHETRVCATDLNRAIVECVAKIQAAKVKP